MTTWATSIADSVIAQVKAQRGRAAAQFHPGAQEGARDALAPMRRRDDEAHVYRGEDLQRRADGHRLRRAVLAVPVHEVPEVVVQ